MLFAMTVACSGTSAVKRTDSVSQQCVEASGLVDRADANSRDGFLGRALADLERANELCPSEQSRAGMAAVRHELWLDDVEAYSVDALVDERRKALLLYREGVNLRLANPPDYEDSLRQLEKSYQLAPHVLTIVQMAMTHRAAGHEVDFRKALARALAIAELTEGQTAMPVIDAGHAGVVSAAFSPDGHTFATGGSDGAIRLWDLRSGLRTATLSGHTSGVTALQFNQRGDRLLSGSYDGTAREWDVVHMVELRRLDGDFSHRDVRSIAYAPDGQLIAVGYYGGLRMWDPEQAVVTQTLPRVRDFGLVFAVDGSYFSDRTDEPATIQVVDIGNGAELITDLDEHAWIDATLTPDGTAYIRAASGDRLELIESATGVVVQTFEPGLGAVRSSTFSPDGMTLAVSGDRGNVVVMHVTTAELLVSLATVPVQGDLVFSDDGSRLAAITDQLRMWDLPSGAPNLPLSTLGSITSVAFNGDASAFAVAAHDSTVAVWHPLSPTPSPTSFGHQAEDINAVAFSSDDSMMATGSSDGSTRLWNTNDGSLARVIETASPVRAVAFRPDRDVIATGHGDGLVRLWAPSSGAGLEATDRIPSSRQDDVFGVAWSHDGRLLAIAADQGFLPVYDVDADLVRSIIPDTNSPVYTLAFRPGDQEVAFGTDRGAIALLLTDYKKAVDGKRRIIWLQENGSPARALAFDPSGATLAVGSDDGTVSVWDVDAKTVLRVMDHGASVSALALGGDGRWLISGSGNGIVAMWDFATGTRIATLARGRAGSWVILAGGHVDASADADDMYYWQVGALQLPGFVGAQSRRIDGLLREVTSAARWSTSTP